jgi:hypothetical protein
LTPEATELLDAGTPLPMSMHAFTKTERLAFEIALGDDDERRVADGELVFLETAWREAEEIAAIVDDLLLPASVTAWLRQHARSRTD